MRVLIVEDNEINAVLTRTLLEHAGHSVEVAADGERALDLLEAAPAGAYDLVFMDLQLPGMDGFETTQCVRALPGGRGCVPVVALTANAAASDEEACLAAGMDGYLPKPVTFEVLIATLESWRGRSSAKAAPIR